MGTKQNKQGKQDSPVIVIGEGVALTATEQASVLSAVQSVQAGDYSAATKFDALVGKYVSGERKAKALSRVYGAVALFGAHQTGQIGEGGKWKSQAAWAKAHGMTSGNASGLNNLGRAISVGYGPSFPTWAKASSKAGTKDVAAALNKGKDGAEVDRLVGAALSKPNAPRNVDKDANKGSDQIDEGTESTEQPVDIFVASKDAAKALDTWAKDLTADQWPIVRDMLAKTIERENTLRTATPATVAKRSKRTA